MEKKSLIPLALVLTFGLLTGGMFVKYTAPACNSNISSSGDNNVSKPADTAAENDNNKTENTDNAEDITYATFSSPKADFTFEYPDTWVYDENESNGTISWRFYPKSADNHNGMPYLELQAPIEDPGAISFSTGAPDLEKGLPLRPYHYAIYVFSTNDPKTFVTYQWSGKENLKNGSGHIYWQKGEYFADSSYLLDHKYNYMRTYSIPENGQEIGLHIAQSIKIK